MAYKITDACIACGACAAECPVVYKTYGDWPDKTTRLGLYYTGADENDKPNLLPLLDDWKTDYQWEDWYYSGSFEQD